MRNVRTALVSLSAGAVLLAGCGGDDPTADPSPAGEESSSPAASATVSASASAPAVEPASGKVVREEQFSVSFPQGWRVDEKVLGMTFGDDPRTFDDLSVSVDDGTGLTEQELMRTRIETISGARLERQPDTEIAGVTAWHFSGRDSTGLLHVEVFGLLVGQDDIALKFQLEGGSKRRQEIIDSVLASWQWT